ncbi:hypothetical protein NHG29_01905 [Aerococcaceae bacterium NML160702]|nr:hypothetical protein [Aerococcaceae bacterium NML160702]
MKKLLAKITKFRKGVSAVMINFFVMQIEMGWITINEVPKKYRKKVQALLDQANAGLDDEDKAQADEQA